MAGFRTHCLSTDTHVSWYGPLIIVVQNQKCICLPLFYVLFAKPGVFTIRFDKGRKVLSFRHQSKNDGMVASLWPVNVNGYKYSDFSLYDYF